MTELTTFLFGLALMILVVRGLPSDVFSPESKSLLFRHRVESLSGDTHGGVYRLLARCGTTAIVFPNLRAEADCSR